MFAKNAIRFATWGALSLGLVAGLSAEENTPAKAAGGTISGKALFDGAVPEAGKLTIDKDMEVCGKRDATDKSLLVGKNKGIKNVVISIKKIDAPDDWKGEGKTAEFDQVNCEFTTRVLVIPVDSSVELKNSDPVLHNVHTYSRRNTPINQGIPASQTLTKKFDAAETVQVTCDVHKWMKAWIVVADHPWYSLTSEDGSFELKDVPPGEYEIVAWHEELGKSKTKHKDVVVKAGETTKGIDFEFKPKK
ncbi:MAG: hypothetical protein RL885_04420 [Planctomycetota bacterium]